MKFASLIILAMLLPLKTMGAAPASSPEKVEKGKKLFENNCVACHGSGGKGDGVAAAALNPTPRNLVTGPYNGGGTPDEVFATITNGLKGSSVMAGFKNLSEEERWALTFFVLSLKAK